MGQDPLEDGTRHPSEDAVRRFARTACSNKLSEISVPAAAEDAFFLSYIRGEGVQTKGFLAVLL
jgi:hypothetical protein